MGVTSETASAVSMIVSTGKPSDGDRREKKNYAMYTFKNRESNRNVAIFLCPQTNIEAVINIFGTS